MTNIPSSSPPAPAAPRSNRNLILVLAGLAFACVCGFVCVSGAIVLGGSGAITALLSQATPTREVVPATATPTPAIILRTPTGITPIRTPTPVKSDTTVVLTDNFTGTCNLLEGDNDKRTFKCENGTYTMLNKTNSSRWVYYSDEWPDIVMEADARAISGPAFIEYGIIFRVAGDGKSFYGFTVTRDGQFTVFRYNDPDFTDLISYTSNPAIKTGANTNRLKIVAQGNQIAAYVNDQWLNTVTDSNFQNGTVGLFINNRDPNAKAGFSNLKVSQINNRLTLPRGVPTATATPPR